MPPQPPVHIVLDRHGRQIDASSIIKQLYRIERLSDWSHPETQNQIAELAGKLIAATGSQPCTGRPDRPPQPSHRQGVPRASQGVVAAGFGGVRLILWTRKGGACCPRPPPPCTTDGADLSITHLVVRNSLL